MYSIRLLNDLLMSGRQCTKDLDHIKKLNNEHTKNDLVLRMVISTLKTTEWRKFYGLNITETMDLEFADYHFMCSELAEYDAELKAGADKIKQQLSEGEGK